MRPSRNRPRASVIALAGLLLVPASLQAQVGLFGAPSLQTGATSAGQVEASDEGALFLLLPSGAQGVALGRAMTALSSSESAFWNPAGLANLYGNRVILVRGEHVVGESTGFSAVWGSRSAGALGVSYQLLDMGTLDSTDRDGQVVGSISIRSHQALLSGAIRTGPRLRLGVNLKSLQFRVACRGQCPDGNVSATAYAMDLGLQSRPLANRPLEVGIMLAHLGPDFRVADSDQSDPLPGRIRVGAAYDVLDGLLEEELGMYVIVEVEDRIRDPGNTSLFLGTEFLAGAADQFFVRGGYIFGNRNQTDGAALGIGVRYERFEFGIARSLARGGPQSSDEPIHLTLGLAF
jgi:hypothetical protein